MSDQDFETIFDGKQPAEPQAEPAPTTAPEPQAEPQEAPKGEAQEPASADPATGEPPAPGNEKNVPLAALEAVRKEKTDWKEKAIRYEEQIKQLEARQHAPQQPPQPQREMTPQEFAFNERLHTSELLAREKHADMDEKLAAWEAAAAKNPAMGAELLNQRHPWEYVYQQGARLLAMREIGDDPAAYKERLRQELLAEMQAQPDATAQPAPTPAPAAALPTSLATARSTAGRSAAAFTGPRPFDDIFK
ncbi:hypothetical protein CEY09_30460 [Achromobacter marplatensis]|uniref:Scaffolding protein n=1 Tax=Achromobacter marplatensis TaxID=470868 RepID=A0ABX9FYE1_9BURK|nr:hypothetical protein [Achromobacter marplatensis]OWT55313.1 hypothetical protein CEY09_30460 [Achromobacter marplatensis]RBP10655.1 hypothetical protein DFP87_12518 [Achromobacter marplatensis]CAB3713046.1 hypothetical protein LMG26219_06039 [Achromobacter marplatensis]